MSVYRRVRTNHNKGIGRIEKMKYGVGIDVSKGKSIVSILSIEGEVIGMESLEKEVQETLKLLNNRSRKCINYKTSIELFNELLCDCCT